MKVKRGLRISSRKSVMLSFILTVLTTAGVIAALIALPWLWRWLIGYYGKPESDFTATLLLAYAALVPAFAASVCLLRLLLRIMGDAVFTKESVALLRAISWCCFAEAPVFAFMAYYYFTSVVLSFAAVFLGLILRVIKNVIEQATELKQENDLTV